MALDETLIGKAVDILTKARFTKKTSVETATERLFDYAPFDSKDEEDVEAIARAAIARLPDAAAPPPRPVQRNQSGGGGGRTTYAPKGATRKDPPNFEPTAGYRFVDLPDVVAKPDGAISQTTPVPGGVSATIHVAWAVETPLLIGAEKGANGIVEPMTLAGSTDWVIPGATLRGMLRTSVEIVALARIGAVDRHLRFGLRDFDHHAYAHRSEVSKLASVQAGWLTWEDGDREGKGTWYLTPIGKNWAHVPIASDLLGRGDVKGWSGRSLLEKYDAVGMCRADGSIDFRRTEEFGAPIPDSQGRPASSPGHGRKGVLVFSGKLPGGGNKKYEYVFFDVAGGAPVPIAEDVKQLFLRLHTKPAKNRVEPDGSWKDLTKTLAAGGRVPVFHVGDPTRGGDPWKSGGFFFGLTRLFKVPHERSIGDVIADQKEHALPSLVEVESEAGAPRRWRYGADFVENLFGYVLDGKDVTFEGEAPANDRLATSLVARKGRIAFEFAHLAETCVAAPSETVQLILSAPRASYAPFYLRAKGAKDYSSKEAPRIAGRKRYVPRWPSGTPFRTVLEDMRRQGVEQMRAAGLLGKKNDNVVSTLRFLEPKGGRELRFTSRIRLHNVTAEELGAVLFALTHGGDPTKPYRHMIGRARAFGAGQMRVASARLVVTPNDTAGAALLAAPIEAEIVSNDGMKGFAPEPTATHPSHSHRPFLERFEEAMAATLREANAKETVPSLRHLPAIREWLGAAKPGVVDPRRLASMRLTDFKVVRDAVKPLRGANPAAEGPPPSWPDPRSGDPRLGDGRLMPAPAVPDPG